MTIISPDDIPTSVTDLLWTAPFVSISPTERINLTEPDARAVLAHFWPAIEQHIREQVASDLEAVDPVDWALAGQHAGQDAAAIARGADITRSTR